MEKFFVKLIGVSPYLMNPMVQRDLGVCGAKKRMSLRQEAHCKLSKNHKGEVGIPSLNLFSCLVEAGHAVTLEGRRHISTRRHSFLGSLLTIEDDFLVFQGSKGGRRPKWVPDVRYGSLFGFCKSSIRLVRPKFPRWSFECVVGIDTARIDPQRVFRLFETAGQHVGLGDFRPACRGRFGRFKVAEWGPGVKKDKEAAA